MSRLVNSVQSLQHVDDEFGEIILAISASDRVTISTHNPIGNSATNLLVFGDEIPNLGAGAAHPPLDSEEPRWMMDDSAYHVDAAMREQHAIVQWSENVALAAGLKSTMVAPIRWQGENIAAITFRARNLENYNSSHLNIATDIANQVSGAIANQIALQKSHDVAHEREVLARISRLATGANDLHDTFDQITSSVKELIPWDRTAVTAFQSGTATTEEYLFQAGVQYNSTDVNTWPAVANDMIELFANDPTPIIIDQHSMAESPDILRGQALVEKSGLKSWLLVPLIWRNNHIGHLHFRTLKADAFNDYHVDIAAQISNQISGAIAGAIANQNLAVEAQERKVLAEIGRTLSSGRGIINDFDGFSELIKSLIPADRFSISRNSESNTQYFPFLEHGLPFEGIHPDEYAQTRAGITSRIEKLDAPAVMSNLPEDSSPDLKDFTRFAKNSGLHSWLVAPMFWRDELIGSIHFRSKAENAYTERDIRLSGEIAAQLVGHIASTDAYELLEREAKVRNVLAELGRVVASDNDFTSSIKSIESLASSVIEFDGFSVGAVNEKSQTVRRLYANGLYTPQISSDTEFSTANSIATVSLTSKKTSRQQFETLDQLKDFPKSVEAFNEGTRVFLTAPLISNDSVIGVMQFRAASPTSFDEIEVENAQRIADQIAGGLANSIANEQIQLQSAALESTDSAIVISAPSGAIQWVNSAFTQLTGWSPAEIIGEPSSIFRSDDPENQSLDREIMATLLGGESWRGIRVTKKKDGSEYPEELAATPVLGPDGEVTHIIGIRHDVTDRLIAEEAHENSLHIESENRELQRVAAARSEFLSTVSHELRTPLTTVSAFADIMFNSKSENLTDRQKMHLGLIRKSSRQLGSLIDDLLDISQADSGKVALSKNPFDITQMVTDIGDSTRVLLATREQRLEIDSQTGSLSVIADRPRVIQIVSNLLTNASKFSPVGATVNLKSIAVGNELSITVTDKGSGISKSDQTMMFSPFFRGDNRKAAEPDGRGLGLAVVRSLVDLHDGTITVDSKYRKGTSITVTLPGVTSVSADS